MIQGYVKGFIMIYHQFLWPISMVLLGTVPEYLGVREFPLIKAMICLCQA